MSKKSDIDQKTALIARLLKEGAKGLSPKKVRIFDKEKKFEEKLVELARFLKKNS